jgi:hypothetical protein
MMGKLPQKGQVGIIADREDVGAGMLLGILPLVSVVRGKFMGQNGRTPVGTAVG